jgi:hypothetical protein
VLGRRVRNQAACRSSSGLSSGSESRNRIECRISGAAVDLSARRPGAQNLPLRKSRGLIAGPGCPTTSDCFAPEALGEPWVQAPMPRAPSWPRSSAALMSSRCALHLVSQLRHVFQDLIFGLVIFLRRPRRASYALGTGLTSGHGATAYDTPQHDRRRRPFDPFAESWFARRSGIRLIPDGEPRSCRSMITLAGRVPAP